VRLLYVHIGQLAVVAGHLQAGVPQQPLQAEHVAPVAQEADGCGVAQGMRRDADAGYAGPLAVAHHPVLDMAFSKPASISGKEQEVAVWVQGLRAMAADVAPQEALNLCTHGDMALLAALAQHLDQPIVEHEVVHPDTGELGDPQPAVQQSKDHGVVAEALSGGRVDSGQQPLELGRGEGGYHLLRHPRQFNPVERVVVYYLLVSQPAPEGADGAQVAVDGVAGKAVLAGLDVGVFGEAALALQVQDEGPDFPGGYKGDIGLHPIRDKELFEVADAVDGDVDGAFTLALAFGAQPVAGGQVG
jgi:hypothetical protein